MARTTPSPTQRSVWPVACGLAIIIALYLVGFAAWLRDTEVPKFARTKTRTLTPASTATREPEVAHVEREGLISMDAWAALTPHRQAAAAIAALDPTPTRAVARAARGDLLWPAADKHLNSDFGYRTNPFSGAVQLHRGVDVRAACGSPVMAAAAGVVAFAGWTESAGNTVKVTHANGLVTMYAHLSELSVAAGNDVAQGDLLGLSGDTGSQSTGPHLHFEVWRSGVAQNPMHYRFHHAAVAKVAQVAMGGCARRATDSAVGSREDEPDEDVATFAENAYDGFVGR